MRQSIQGIDEQSHMLGHDAGVDLLERDILMRLSNPCECRRYQRVDPTTRVPLYPRVLKEGLSISFAWVTPDKVSTMRKR